MVGTSPVPLIPEASKEDLEKLSLELSAAEPRPYPDPAALELPMSVPSTSGSEDPAVGQDDASVSGPKSLALLLVSLKRIIRDSCFPVSWKSVQARFGDSEGCSVKF